MWTSRGAALPSNVVGSNGCRRGGGGVLGMLELDDGGAVAVAYARRQTAPAGRRKAGMDMRVASKDMGAAVMQ